MSVFFKRRGKAEVERVNYISWIESTGTQFIDTGIVPRVGYTAEIDFQATYIPGGDGESWVMSVFDMNATGYPRMRVGIVGGAYWTSDTNAFTFSGSVGERTIAKNGSVSRSGCTLSLYLFAAHERTGAAHLANSRYRLYSCKIYDASGNMLRDYKPCYDLSGVACLYDEVEGKYYYNAGTGEFGVGESASGESKQITFTVDGTAYTAEDGMTWAQWVNSSYNTAGFTNNGIEILHPIQGSVADETTTSWYVKTTDEIVAGRAYLVTA